MPRRSHTNDIANSFCCFNVFSLVFIVSVATRMSSNHNSPVYNTRPTLDVPFLDACGSLNFRRKTGAQPIMFLHLLLGNFPVFLEHYASWHAIVQQISCISQKCHVTLTQTETDNDHREDYALTRQCLVLLEGVEDNFHRNTF